MWLPELWRSILLPFQVENYLKSHETRRKIIHTNQHSSENPFFKKLTLLQWVNLNIHDHVQKKPPLNPLLSQHAKIMQVMYSAQVFQLNIFYSCIILVHATSPTHFILLDFVTLTSFQDYKL